MIIKRKISLGLVMIIVDFFIFVDCNNCFCESSSSVIQRHITKTSSHDFSVDKKSRTYAIRKPKRYNNDDDIKCKYLNKKKYECQVCENSTTILK